VSTLSVIPNTRSVLWRRIFLIEQVIVGIGLVAYALLVSMNQRTSLWVTMIATLAVGNLLVPVALGSRRLYVERPRPWNWVAFFPAKSYSA
jgi:lipoprotein signal peptidase